MTDLNKTQLARATNAVTLLRFFSKLLTRPLQELKEVVSEAQNRPPQGGSDNTISASLWTELRDIAQAFAKASVLVQTDSRPGMPYNAIHVYIAAHSVLSDMTGDEESWTVEIGCDSLVTICYYSEGGQAGVSIMPKDIPDGELWNKVREICFSVHRAAKGVDPW